MKNWKTTVIGYIAGLLPIVIKLIFKVPVEATDVTTGAGIIGLGHAAADAKPENK